MATNYSERPLSAEAASRSPSALLTSRFTSTPSSAFRSQIAVMARDSSDTPSSFAARASAATSRVHARTARSLASTASSSARSLLSGDREFLYQMLSATAPGDCRRIVLIVYSEHKIDAIEDRLEGIEKLLQQLVAKNVSLSPALPTPTATATASPSSTTIDTDRRISRQEVETKEHVECESSFSAFAQQARRTLEELLECDPSIRAGL
ncbi:hypothetical protein MRB53_037333 [Persea americana]|nr:hypothetical protein MRB53_037333 [Persea americana]